MAYGYKAANLRGHKDLAKLVRELREQIEHQNNIIRATQGQLKEARRRNRMHAANQATTTPQEYEDELAKARRMFPEPVELKNRRLRQASEELFHRAASKPRPSCGTYSSYMAHIRRGENSCNECKAALNDYRQKLRARKAAA